VRPTLKLLRRTKKKDEPESTHCGTKAYLFYSRLVKKREGGGGGKKGVKHPPQEKGRQLLLSWREKGHYGTTLKAIGAHLLPTRRVECSGKEGSGQPKEGSFMSIIKEEGKGKGRERALAYEADRGESGHQSFAKGRGGEDAQLIMDFTNCGSRKREGRKEKQPLRRRKKKKDNLLIPRRKRGAHGPRLVTKIYDLTQTGKKREKRGPSHSRKGKYIRSYLQKEKNSRGYRSSRTALLLCGKGEKGKKKELRPKKRLKKSTSLSS